MSGIPYLSSDGVMWLIMPPEGDPISMDDGEGGHVLVSPSWHGEIVNAAYGRPAGTQLVASTDLEGMHDAIETFITVTPKTHVEVPKAKASGGGLVAFGLLLLWLLSERKKGR